jgi:hypothetical protein
MSIATFQRLFAAALLVAFGYYLGYLSHNPATPVQAAVAQPAPPAAIAPSTVTIIRGSRIEERPVR